MTERELGDLIARYRRQARLTQEGVAARLSDVLGRRVQQSQVSDNEKGTRWGDPDLPAAYLRALDIPVEEMMSAQGYPKPAKASGRLPSVEDLLKKDPSLSAEAKKHLIATYKYLRRNDPGPGGGARTRSAS